MLKFIKKLIRGIVVAFLASTILSVVALRFIPVWFTPLMFIRCIQQMKDGKELRMTHHWVSLSEMPESMPQAVRFSAKAGSSRTARARPPASSMKSSSTRSPPSATATRRWRS